MSESYFEITDQEWRSGSLAEDKLDQVQESFNSIGFAVVAGLVPPAICEQLMTASQSTCSSLSKPTPLAASDTTKHAESTSLRLVNAS